ncbi:MAG: N-acetylmuramoyl-L-alanine amidase [Selenomonadaceae bacterium]|nr:N-acetylmuramoyl-L-alanine amidase [Selenomonadaceae bacterium]
MEKFTRRNFISMTTKFLAGAAVFGLTPNFAEAAEKTVDDKKIVTLDDAFLSPVKDEKEVLKFDMPPIPKFQTLSELNISAPRLRFVQSMDQRKFTSTIVIHNAGLTRDVESSLQEIHRMHLGNGWAGVGYHFIVHKNGVIEHARPIDRIGAHSYKHNRYTVGICMTGNYNIGVPTREQTLATEKLVAALCQNYDIVPSITTIVGHRDLCDTDCPGFNVYPRLPELIQNVKAVL